MPISKLNFFIPIAKPVDVKDVPKDEKTALATENELNGLKKLIETKFGPALVVNRDFSPNSDVPCNVIAVQFVENDFEIAENFFAAATRALDTKNEVNVIFSPLADESEQLDEKAHYHEVYFKPEFLAPLSKALDDVPNLIKVQPILTTAKKSNDIRTADNKAAKPPLWLRDDSDIATAFFNTSPASRPASPPSTEDEDAIDFQLSDPPSPA